MPEAKQPFDPMNLIDEVLREHRTGLINAALLICSQA